MMEKKNQHQRNKTIGQGYPVLTHNNSSQGQNVPLQNKSSFRQKNHGHNQFKQNAYIDQDKKSNSIFEDPVEESRYLKFLLKDKYKLIENEEQAKQRAMAIKQIESLVNSWQQEIAIQTKKIAPEEASSKNARIVSFGSYKLGAHSPTTDLDLICVLPTYITQNDFFNQFKMALKDCEDIEYVNDVIDAKIPILKVKFRGYQIDLLYSVIEPNILSTSQSIDKIIKDEQLFNKLNPTSQNSLNGLKAALNLQKSVPNLPKFRTTLRLVKFWAMRRCIYSNSLAYLGGISYSVMVAKICQDYPDLEVCDLLHKFFSVYSEWKWMDPVSIKIGKKKDKLNINALQAIESYSLDCMLILSPISNPKNLAYRVCKFTHHTICRELTRARNIMQQIAPRSHKRKQSPEIADLQSTEEIKQRKYSLDNVIQIQKRSYGQEVKWTKLFKKARFFHCFNHFIKVDVLSHDQEAHRKWLGYVEPQLRRLIQLLGDLETIVDLRVYPKAFSREETQDTMNADFKCCDSYFIGVKVQQVVTGQKIDLRNSVINFCNLLEIGRVQKQANNVRILHFKKKELPSELVDNY